MNDYIYIMEEGTIKYKYERIKIVLYSIKGISIQ